MPMARVPPTELAFAHAVQHLAYAYVTRGIQSTCRCVGTGFPGLGGTPGDRSTLLRPCILQYIIHFPGSRRRSLRPLDAAQTVYFTIYYSLSRVLEELLETARCCSDCVFYNILFTFPGLGGTPRDRSVLLRPCILQYTLNLPGSRRSSRRPVDAAQTVCFTIHA